MAGIVLLSGGLDSAVALALYLESQALDLALTFDYGQRSVKQEIKAARLLAAHYGITHRVIFLPFLAEQTRTSLVSRDMDLPFLAESDLDDIQGQALESALNVWVPNRNGLFINIAAVYAENLEHPANIITGFNSEEAATFPDNSVDFISAINQSLRYSARQIIEVASPTAKLTKTDIVREGLRLGIPWDYIWSCYSDESQLCGECESCRRFRRALLTNGQDDLAEKIFKNVWQNKENLK
ncbi:MAG TPA: 7-cyano-7-deazaguanine synthase QueC [Desulfitobacteriaceae bacterium]|nr:7-cyano-7-deazaguanine synthase QueC [Desulfitobacteriaceae bacterium]